MEEEYLTHEEELEIDAIAEDDVELDVEAGQRKIIWQAKDFSIREFLTMKNDGELILQPLYQRNFVATDLIASKLIESILLDVPIPVVYLAEEQDGSFSVIDGQQRLTSFLSFLEGKFPDSRPFKLSGLKVLPELNRKLFIDLEGELQKKIRSTTIHSIIIKKESNPDIKFEIFERLNTGSTKLNEDEIRNTVYRGSYIELLAELSENPVFHNLVKKDNFKKRMIYRGMILRFFALSEKSYINYKSSMKQFSNKELRDNRDLSPNKVKEYRARFEHCLDLVKVVFGEMAFRRYMPGESGMPGKWGETQINMALYDIQMVGFVNYSKNEVLAKADLIREGLLDLMTNNQQFKEQLIWQTSDTDVLKKRFRTYMDMLESIIGDPQYSQRTFSFSVKEELYKNNPYCAISKQKILAIEDSEVDHIVPYSKGGKTEISNAQLVLRYFNRAKSDKMADQ
jgi:hypothetical protein